MEKAYWLGRKRSAVAMAEGAADARTRLIHYDLAGRYSIKAATCLPPAFMIAPSTIPGGLEPAALPLAPPESGPAWPDTPDHDQETRR